MKDESAALPSHPKQLTRQLSVIHPDKAGRLDKAGRPEMHDRQPSTARHWAAALDSGRHFKSRTCKMPTSVAPAAAPAARVGPIGPIGPPLALSAPSASSSTTSANSALAAAAAATAAPQGCDGGDGEGRRAKAGGRGSGRIAPEICMQSACNQSVDVSTASPSAAAAAAAASGHAMHSRCDPRSLHDAEGDDGCKGGDAKGGMCKDMCKDMCKRRSSWVLLGRGRKNSVGKIGQEMMRRGSEESSSSEATVADEKRRRPSVDGKQMEEMDQLEALRQGLDSNGMSRLAAEVRRQMTDEIRETISNSLLESETNTARRVIEELAEPLNAMIAAIDDIKAQVDALKSMQDATQKWMG